MANSLINAMTDTWNAAGTTFTAVKMTVTNTASAAGSAFLELLDGATSRFKIGKGGNITAVGGTVTASTPMLDISQTWNANAQFFGIKANFTVTQSNNTSRIFEFSTGGTVRAYLDEFGLLQSANMSVGTAAASYFSMGTTLRIAAAVPLSWSSTVSPTGTQDIGMRRSAAGVLAIDNGVTAGVYRDIVMRDLMLNPSATRTPAVNGELAIEATSNTSLTFRFKGSDGTVRSAALTLA